MTATAKPLNLAQFTVGDRVGYADINLHDYRGILVEVSRQNNGGDCLVDWKSPNTARGVECLRNLRPLQS